MKTKESIKKDVNKYWNDRPCNIRHSKKEFCSREYFNEVEEKKYFVEPHIPKFAEFNKWQGKRVLEIGGGIGTDSINFARNGAKLTIVEFSEKSLEICKKRFEVFGLKAEFYLGDVEKLEEILPPMQRFDLIYSFGVIHHTPNPNLAFEQIRKYMDVNTELRVMLYSKISYKLFWVMMENDVKHMSNMEDLIRKNAEAQYDCPVAYTYTFKEIGDMLNKCDINVEKIWKDHIFSYSIPEYKDNKYVKDKYWKDVDPKLFKQFEDELGWHTMFIAKIKSQVLTNV
jgi:2-polyprenyl-3-methyl-5-hydroxy-6-metoxy-1,4-benzoquinol methylase